MPGDISLGRYQGAAGHETGRAFSLIAGLAACSKDSGSGSGSPTAPTMSTQTRVIRIEAGLDFGDVPVGSTSDRILRIYNEGNVRQRC